MNWGGVSPGLSLVITNPSGSVIEVPVEVLVGGEVLEAGAVVGFVVEDPVAGLVGCDAVVECAERDDGEELAPAEVAAELAPEVPPDAGTYTVDAMVTSGPAEPLLQAAAARAVTAIIRVPTRSRRCRFTCLHSVVTRDVLPDWQPRPEHPQWSRGSDE
jgi:hypothetical protein